MEALGLRMLAFVPTQVRHLNLVLQFAFLNVA